MSIYAGLDVSDKTTHICVVDADGKVLRRDVLASDPDVLAKWLTRHCPDMPPLLALVQLARCLRFPKNPGMSSSRRVLQGSACTAPSLSRPMA